MTTATYDLTGPLLVSDLPANPATVTSPGMLNTWLTERRVLRQLRAFDRAVQHLDEGTRSEVLAAARRSR